MANTKPKTTIRDVAKLSGISVATVSKYLNGRSVREKSARQIEEAIQELNYHVNQTARGLSTTRSMLIGVITGDLNSFSGDIISALSETLEPFGYCILIREFREDPERFSSAMDFFINIKGVDGVVIISSFVSAAMLEPFKDYENIVVADNAFTDTNYDFVVSDNLSGSYHATEQFIMNGHKNIAIIADDNVNTTMRERLNGYKRCLRDYEISVREPMIVHQKCTSQGGYLAFSQIVALLSGPDAPTAVLISSFHMSLGALMAARDLKVRIPDDISVICFDNFDVSCVTTPRLICIEQPVREIGLTAANLMLRRLNGEASGCSIMRLPTRMTDGESVRTLDRL